MRRLEVWGKPEATDRENHAQLRQISGLVCTARSRALRRGQITGGSTDAQIHTVLGLWRDSQTQSPPASGRRQGRAHAAQSHLTQDGTLDSLWLALRRGSRSRGMFTYSNVSDRERVCRTPAASGYRTTARVSGAGPFLGPAL